MKLRNITKSIVASLALFLSGAVLKGYEKQPDRHIDNHYRATVTDVYDGDTITIDIDLGLGIKVTSKVVRLSRINAPEVKGKERKQGFLSRDFLRSMILGKRIIIETTDKKGRDKKGSFGRLLGDIWILDGTRWINVNDWMVESGLATYKDY